MTIIFLWQNYINSFETSTIAIIPIHLKTFFDITFTKEKPFSIVAYLFISTYNNPIWFKNILILNFLQILVASPEFAVCGSWWCIWNLAGVLAGTGYRSLELCYSSSLYSERHDLELAWKAQEEWKQHSLVVV